MTRKKRKKFVKTKTAAGKFSSVKQNPEAENTSERYVQKHLFPEPGGKSSFIPKTNDFFKKNQLVIKKYFCYIIGAIALMLLIWFLVFPIVANTGIMKEHLESILSKRLNVKVETGKVSFSNWGKFIKINANSVNLLDAEDDSFIAYMDGIHFELSPLYVLFGEEYLKHIKINRLDIELPAVSIQKFMFSKGYLSRTFYKSSLKFKDDSMSFQNIDIKVKPIDSKLQIAATGDCEIPFFKDAAFEFSGIYNSVKDHLDIDCFHLWGNRIIDKREFISNTIVRSVLETPVRVDISGEITKEYVDLPDIHLMLDLCQGIAAFKKSKSGLSFNININNQDFPNVGRLFKTRSRNEQLRGVNFQLRAHTSKENQLISKGSLTAEKGTLRGVPFESASLDFVAVNDRITALESSARFWNGYGYINLLEEVRRSAKGSRKNLVGEIYSSGIDLNDCLSSMVRVPALTGGGLTLKLDFDFENLGIGEFLTKKLPEFNFEHATGMIILSNAYLSHFSDQEWQSSPEIPGLVKDYLGIAGNITESSVSIPLLNKFIKKLSLNKPRTLKTSVIIENGKLSTPEVFADTPVGELIAKGSFGSNDVMNYKIQLRLNKNISDEYYDNPILSMFRKDKIIELPIILSGELSRPDVKLNLNEEEQKEFEKRLTDIIAERLTKSMKKRDPDFVESDNIKERIKKTIRSVIKRLL